MRSQKPAIVLLSLVCFVFILTAPAQSLAAGNAIREVQASLEEIAEKATPSVVQLTVVRTGVEQARAALDSGAALAKLRALANFTQKFAG